MTDFIVWFAGSFISTFGISFLYYNLSNATRKLNLKITLVFIIGVLFLSIIKNFNLSYINIFAYFLFYPFLFYMINPIKLKKLFYYILVIWFIGMLLDLLSMLLVSFLHSFLNFDLIEKWNAATIILSFISFLCFILISKSKRILLFINTWYNKLSNIKYSDFLLLFLTAFIFISAFVILTSLPNLTLDILFNLLIFLVIIVFIFIIKYKINEEEISKYLKLLKENNEFYVSVDDEHRVFKHNLMARLLSIKSVSNKKTMVLIDDLIRDFNVNIDFSNHIKVIPYGLNGIIYQKLYPYFNKVNLKIFNGIKYDIFDFLKPLRYNVLIEKLSLVLDNALESCTKSVDKVIVINIFDEDNNIVIEVKNTFSDMIDIDSLGSKNYSTKGKRRGLGLYSALRNSEVQLTVKVVNHLFISRLVARRN